MISRYAMLGAGAMQTAAMAGATMGLRTSMANEQAIISFKTLLGTQEQASAMFKELQTFAATTPFEFPQLRDAASKLLTTGVAADRVIPIMTALGDSTAAMGTGAEGIQRAVYALQQMNLAGKVTGQDMMQLANAGIPAWDALASAAGMSVAEVKKAVEKGTLQDAVPMLMSGIEQYSGAAMTRVKGMMAEQSQTLTGMMSTLKDTVNIALADMMQPAVAGIKEALPGITTLIQQTFAGLTGPINSMVQTLVTAFSALLPTMQPIVTAFSGLMVAALTALVPLFVKFAELIPQLAPAISAMAQVITDLATAFGPLIVQLAEDLVPIINLFAEGVSKVTGFLADHQGAIEALTPVLGALVAAMVAYKTAAGIAAGIDIVSQFVKAIGVALGYTVAVEAQTAATVGATGAQTALNTAMTLNPIGAIIALIAALVAAFVILWMKFEGFRNFWKTVWNGIVKGVEWAVNKLLGVWEWWVNKFIDGVNLLIKGWNLIPFKEDIQELKHVNWELDLSAALLSTAGKQAVTSAGQFRMFEEQMNKVAFAADNANKSVSKLGGDRGYEMLQKSKPKTTTGGGGGLAKGMTEAEKKAKKLKETMKDLREQIKQTYEDGIAAAQQKLQELKDAQNEYALSVSSGITGQATLGTAFSAVTDAITKQQNAYDQFLNVIEDVIQNAVSFSKVLEDQKAATEGLTAATKKQSEAEVMVAEAQAEVDAITRKLNATRNRGRRLEYQKELIEANKKLTDAETELGTATKGVSTAQEQADKVGSGFVSGLEKQVRAAQAFAQQLADLKKLGLDEAAMRQVLSAGAEAGGKIATELLAGGVETINKTNTLVKELDKTAKESSSALAGEYYKVGQLTAGALLDAMEGQTGRAIGFADKIKTLVQMGLSKENIATVLNAGVVAGYDIADALIKGGEGTVAKANLLQDNLKTAADAAGREAGKKYYDLGVTLATQIVNGLIEEWNRVKPTLPNMTLPELQKTLTDAQKSVDSAVKSIENISAPPNIVDSTPTPTPAAAAMPEYVAAAYMALGSAASASAFKAISTPAVTRATIVDQFLDIVNRQFSKSWQTLGGYFNATGVKGMASVGARKDRWEAFAKANGVPAYGKGGIVMGPQLALIGEAGPEAVIPLNRLNSGGSQYNIVVNAGMGTDGAEVGRQIVSALREYERRNGKLPISTRR
jgi:tape measure domain-containing protein